MKVGIVAGETSGDLLGARLIAAVRKHLPQVQFVGIAGPKMQAAGATSLFPMEKLAVRGYVEVLRHFLELLRIRKQLAAHFLADPPRVFIGIDAPDFNLDLEAKLKASGIATVQYVSPQIWAWRAERIRTIKRAASLVLTLFPFESAWYEREQIPVRFVGHPLADMIPLKIDKAAAREKMRIGTLQRAIALLPGSRVSELHYHARLFVATAELIQRAVPEALFLVPLASARTRALFESALARSNVDPSSVRIMNAHAQHALEAADVALVASGTATLEAALLKCPTVITYRLSALSYWMIKRKMQLPYVGMPNVLLGERFVPEYIQDDATPDKLSAALLSLLRDTDMQAKMVERFTALHLSLKQDNAERTAQAILPFLEGGRIT